MNEFGWAFLFVMRKGRACPCESRGHIGLTLSSRKWGSVEKACPERSRRIDCGASERAFLSSVRAKIGKSDNLAI